MSFLSSIDRLVANSMHGPAARLIVIISLFAGYFALQVTPREEEPQIVVPMVDVLISSPGLQPRQVERLVITPLENLLAQIPGVEHIYSTAHSGRGVVTLRFEVGQDRETSILNTYIKLYSNQDLVPPMVASWVVKPVEVDDVPIAMLALWSERPDVYGDFELRRMADEAAVLLQGLPQVSEIRTTGGRERRVQILLDPASMAARKTTPLDVLEAIRLSNQLVDIGELTLGNQAILFESGDVLRSLAQLENLIVNVLDGNPVFLKDLAQVRDGPASSEHYTWIDFAPAHPGYGELNGPFPMVTLSVAKQRGSNAVAVSESVLAELERIRQRILPDGVRVEVLRDYGETANEKVNNLAGSLAFAILTVVVFIGVFLGPRPALIVGLAIPICYCVTLAFDYVMGYTINRVTLFALILALGLLVDDPITGIDNITRYLAKSGADVDAKIVAAMSEIKIPLIMSTLTIILAFIPLAFITGMMGPYMAPMAFNVPVTVIVSTLVALMVTPWLAGKLLRSTPEDDQQGVQLLAVYRRGLGPLLDNRRWAKMTLWAVLVLFLLAVSLPLFRVVPLKLLPLDNKNEVQILIDLREGSGLEQTAAVASRISEMVQRVPEVKAIGAFVGIASPIDFNGMVRRYYQRNQPHLGELRLTLAEKGMRVHQSHSIVLRLRQLLEPLQVDGLVLRVIEVPPGPPVLSTLVAELYGTPLTPYSVLQDSAKTLAERLRREPHVVEVDTTVEDDAPLWRFVVDKQKAALSGVATEDINLTLAMANHGRVAGYLSEPREARPLPLEIRLDQSDRGNEHDLLALHVKGRQGITLEQTDQGLEGAPQPLVALAELGTMHRHIADKSIHHKDLKPVVYVTADLSGRTPAEVIADLATDQDGEEGESVPWDERTYFNNGGADPWSLPEGVRADWAGEGEWRITIRVFRDMGLAFIFALIAIYVVLRVQTGSLSLSLIIMSSIPLTFIGIMPGFALMNQFGETTIAGAPDFTFFTATAMIGMIALAGIVVRNSLILVEFIEQQRRAGVALKEALIQAGAIRMRPILLTAGTTLLGNLIIILDPVFSGLALAIIFGIISSTLFTLIVVPVVYYLVFSESATVGAQS